MNYYEKLLTVGISKHKALSISHSFKMKLLSIRLNFRYLIANCGMRSNMSWNEYVDVVDYPKIFGAKLGVYAKILIKEEEED